jgi:ARG/rhodanese/phosphatase superfamily protein
MKAPVSLLAGVLLTGLSLGCSLLNRPAEAKQNDRSAAKSSQASHKASSGPVADWKLGPPVTHQNLTIFPVLSESATSTDEFITLDEGLKSGKVTVSEIGSDGRSRALNHHRQVSDNAEVNRLMVSNNSGKTLVLIGGEIVVGGKQDRIVGHDCIVSSSNSPVPIDVFCVEHGRWQVGRNRSAAADGTAAGTGGSPLFDLAPGIAAPTIREKAQAKKDQSAVWSEVAKTETVTVVASETGTLNRVYEDKRVNQKLDGFGRELKQKLVAKNVVGAVAAINGEIVSADVFANAGMFQAYWPKLLKSYALQAVSTETNEQRQADAGAAASFLNRAATESASQGDQTYRLKEHDSEAAASFELESIGTANKMLHFNRVTKK